VSQVSEPERRKAENEAVFREVNERIEELQREFALAEHEPLRIVCECDRLDCVEQLSVTLETYEHVRTESACFVVVPGHDDPAVEAVVERMDGYVVVRKHAGTPREVAEDTDRRT
jgi:hypothetical protein